MCKCRTFASPNILLRGSKKDNLSTLSSTLYFCKQRLLIHLIYYIGLLCIHIFLLLPSISIWYHHRVRGIYTKHNFPCCTTASDQIGVNPNCVGCCCATRCDTKIMFHVNRPLNVSAKPCRYLYASRVEALKKNETLGHLSQQRIDEFFREMAVWKGNTFAHQVGG
jgi:hypothetical protein